MSYAIGYGMSNSHSLPKGGGTHWRRANPAVTQPVPIPSDESPRTRVEGRAAEPQQTSGQADASPSRCRPASPCNARAHDPQHRRGVVDWSSAYIAALEQSARKAASAKLAGVTLRTVQRRREVDPEFMAAESAAMRVAADMIEDEIMRRAIEGTEEPVYQGGKLVGTVRRFSDALILRLAERAETGSWRPKVAVVNETSQVSPTRADRKARLQKARDAMAANTAGGWSRSLSGASENE